jgi:hypothetical protein
VRPLPAIHVFMLTLWSQSCEASVLLRTIWKFVLWTILKFSVFSGCWCRSCTTACSNQANSKNWPPSIGCKACKWTIFYSSLNMMRWGCIVQISLVFWVWFVHIVFHLLWSKCRCWRVWILSTVLVTSLTSCKEVLDGFLNLPVISVLFVWCFSFLLNCWDKLILFLSVPSWRFLDSYERYVPSRKK